MDKQFKVLQVKKEKTESEKSINQSIKIYFLPHTKTNILYESREGFIDRGGGGILHKHLISTYDYTLMHGRGKGNNTKPLIPIVLVC